MVGPPGASSRRIGPLGQPVVGLLFFLLLIIWCPPTIAQPSPQPSSTAKTRIAAVLSDEEIQQGLPERGPPKNPPKKKEWSGDNGFWGEVGWILVWLLVSFVFLLLLRFLLSWASSLSGGTPRTIPKKKVLASHPDQQGHPEEPGNEDPEALAAAGRFNEAVHQLLRRTIGRLIAHLRCTPAPGVTARGLSLRLPLAPGAREGLVGLVSSVEKSRFGGRPLSRGDWEAGLDSARKALGDQNR